MCPNVFGYGTKFIPSPKIYPKLGRVWSYLHGEIDGRATTEISYLTSRASNSHDFDTSRNYFLIPKMLCGLMFAAGVIVEIHAERIAKECVTDV